MIGWRPVHGFSEARAGVSVIEGGENSEKALARYVSLHDGYSLQSCFFNSAQPSAIRRVAEHTRM